MKRWKPKVDERYYFVVVSGYGNVYVDDIFWCDELADEKLYEVYNCFRTKKQAEIVRKRILKVLKKGV